MVLASMGGQNSLHFLGVLLVLFNILSISGVPRFLRGPGFSVFTCITGCAHDAIGM